MNVPVLYILVGAAAGLAVTVADQLVAPLIRGWRSERLFPAWTPATPGTPAARLFDDFVAILLIGSVVLAFLLAGVL